MSVDTYTSMPIVHIVGDHQDAIVPYRTDDIIPRFCQSRISHLPIKLREILQYIKGRDIHSLLYLLPSVFLFV